MQEDFKLTDLPETPSGCVNPQKEDKLMQNVMKMAKKLEGREIVSVNDNACSSKVIEEKLEKLRRSLGITLKKYETSIEYLNKAIKLKPDHALAYNNLGVIYLEQRNTHLGLIETV